MSSCFSPYVVQVRSTAAVSWEREERAVRALEREVQDRDARLNAREKTILERETKVRVPL